MTFVMDRVAFYLDSDIGVCNIKRASFNFVTFVGTASVATMSLFQGS